MQRFNFRSHPILDSLYIEFKSTTEYIHSVRRVNDNKHTRIEPYEPSTFIFSYFTFNTLYNINWRTTVLNGLRIVKSNNAKKETDRINDYLEFIWNNNKPDRIAVEFSSTIDHVIQQYLAEKGIGTHSTSSKDWIMTNMSDFILVFNEANSKEKKFKDEDIDKFEAYILKPFKNQNLDFSEIKYLVSIIYLIRCNLFHGAKDPEFFEENHQMERFVIYAAILTAINQLLFSTIYRQLSRCAH